MSARHPISLLLRITAFALLAGRGASAGAQLFRDQSNERGGGLMQTCDSSMHVGFQTTLLNDYACVFDPVVVPGQTVPSDMVWSYYYSSSFQQAYGNQLQLTAPWADPYPVCLTVNAYDLQAQQPCSTTVCDMIAPVSNVICTTLVADFEIAAIDGQTITFQDLSSFDGIIQQALWSFGDGASTAGVAPTNTFAGSGPFEVCLTVISGPPYYCTTTLCQWLYLGPGNVECAELVEQGYLYLESGNLVGVIDTSRTSGMYSSIDWDFGDGATAFGNMAVHQYTWPGEFQLCGTLRAWGPLLADTCVSTVCRTVVPQAVSVHEYGAVSYAAGPNPFTDEVTITGVGLDHAAITLHDALGRRVGVRYSAAAYDRVIVDVSQLAAGHYTMRIESPLRTTVLRLIKQ
ncbi:MAG: T9SS type A sorting domain-containing protein [Flavobacteriales bacterium]|nr:T9SS type A sorting domain-containing protein [Flavobacteriales bacterium]